MGWDRQPVAAALVTMFTAALDGTVKVHPLPPEIINGPCIVISRPQPVAYNTFAFGVDDATLPVVIASGVETEDQIETIKTACRAAVAADPTLAGTVANATAVEERNWRNVTGAGGVQLLLVELILQIQM